MKSYRPLAAVWLAALLCVDTIAQVPLKAIPAPSPTQPNLSSQVDWPSPVLDTETHGLILFDLFEYDPREKGEVRWDIQGWRGGDFDRFWFKSEGTQSGTLSDGGRGDLQALYGRLVSAYFNLQAGLSYERVWGKANSQGRFKAALGVQGLAPYSFEIEPVLFISQSGDVSVRLTATQDFLLTQRAIVQFRLEGSAAIQPVKAFGVGSGVNDLSLAFRLRYEFRRELAPYLGVVWNHLFAEAADFARQIGKEPSGISIVAGLRVWY